MLAAIVHKSSAIEEVSIADLRRIFTGTLRAWPDSHPIVLVQQPDERTVQQRTLQILFRQTAAWQRRQLMTLVYQGKELPVIKTLNSDDNAIKFVWNLPGAIAVVDARSAEAAITRVKILRVDGKRPGEPGYPLQ
jgi:ABC-type phosphate transport system substrate-binding protein